MSTTSSTAAKQVAEILDLSEEISSQAKYWFVRTEGGMLFEPFITSQSIAIGYPSISLATIKHVSPDDRGRKILARQIAANQPELERPGLGASQLLKFVHEMKEGDYVIIPSTASSQLAIGTIDGPPSEKELTFEGNTFSGFKKRRSVDWHKRVDREKTNPNLYRVFWTHQTITDITEAAQWIDPLLFQFFKKDDKFHCIFEINQRNGVNARDLFESGVEIFQFADEFASEIGIHEDSRSMETRINLNSPGEWELITEASKYIFLVGAFVVFLNGGGLKMKVKKMGMDVNLSTGGLIKAISEFLNDRKRRQQSDAVTKKLEALQVSDPKEIVKLIEQTNKKK
jgi:restriction system protein